MRTGNVILDVIIQIVLIAIAAATVVWVLGLVAPPPSSRRSCGFSRRWRSFSRCSH